MKPENSKSGKKVSANTAKSRLNFKEKPSLVRRFCGLLRNFLSRYETVEEAHHLDPIYILSSDYTIIRTVDEDLRVSVFLSNELDKAGDEKYALVWFFNEIDADILRLIIKYGQFHKGDQRRKERARRRDIREGVQYTGPSDFRREKIKPIPGNWDTKFMESVKPHQMYPLFQATLSLEIPEMTKLIYTYTAFWLREKNDDQIRKLLRIHRDIDPTEEVEIHNQIGFLASGT